MRKSFALIAISLAGVLLASCDRPVQEVPDPSRPSWIGDAVFYQIFPERFWNGDKTNDPTRESLEYGDVPESWELRSWTGDWYERSEWEKEIGDHFYHNGSYHRRYGGDLQGVIDKMSHIEYLGINTIYFNPLSAVWRMLPSTAPPIRKHSNASATRWRHYTYPFQSEWMTVRCGVSKVIGFGTMTFSGRPKAVSATIPRST